MNGRLDPAVAAVRRAVRTSLSDLAPGRRVVVACSGGADSMALAAGTAFEAAKAGWLVGAVVVDHGLHPDSSDVATRVADRLRTLSPYRGIEPVDVATVVVGTAGGPEGAARRARYQALDAAAARENAVVLLGHTLDDQAETVLLGLARGSGLRSLSGMRPVAGPYRRPLLGLSRAVTTRACEALEVPVWHDPDNDDDRFLRVRLRRTVLPTLQSELGPGVSEALARTADLADADARALETLSLELATEVGLPVRVAELRPVDEGRLIQLRIGPLARAPAALRHRAIRLAALAAGCPAGELFVVHVEAIDALVTDWHGQRHVSLPGHVTAERHEATLVLSRCATDGRADATTARRAAEGPHPAD